MKQTNRVKPALLAFIGTLVMSFSSTNFAESPHPFVAEGFEIPATLETELTAAVKGWIAEKWLFKNAAFPVFDISLEDWDKLPELKR